MPRTLIIVLLLLFSTFNAEAQNSETVVFQNGYEGYACYRIPAILQAADGTLVAFAEARRDGAADKGDIDLVARRSSDNGRTWGALIVVWNDAQNTCGNPVPVVVQETGRIILLGTWNLGEDHESDIERGKSVDSRRVFSMHSDDNGLTWSTPVEITASTKRKGWTWYATGPCHAIQKNCGPHKGRLVIPANHKQIESDGTVECYSHLLYSDDQGASWQIGAISQRGGNESSVAELSNGDLMLNMRHTERADSLRLCAVSRDGGASWKRKWEEKQLIEPRCQGSILNYSAVGEKPSKTLLFSNPRSQQRKNLTIGVSRDNGNTWNRFVPICKGRAAYSDMVFLPDGSIGILYENGDGKGKDDLYKRITFDTVSPMRLLD